jgi:hypothetical protein
LIKMKQLYVGMSAVLLFVVSASTQEQPLAAIFQQHYKILEAHNGSSLERYQYNPAGTVSSLEEIHPDATGQTANVLLMDFTYLNGLLDKAILSVNQQPKETLLFFYNSQEKLELLKIYSKKPKRLLYIYKFIYNERGQIRQRLNTLTKEKEDYEYNQDGQLVKLYFTDLMGIMTYYLTFSYDANVRYYEQPGLPIYMSLHEGSYRPHIHYAPAETKMYLQGQDGVFELVASTTYDNKANKNGMLVGRVVENGIIKQQYTQAYTYE